MYAKTTVCVTISWCLHHRPTNQQHVTTARRSIVAAIISTTKHHVPIRSPDK
jgi:hypothetical protein